MHCAHESDNHASGVDDLKRRRGDHGHVQAVDEIEEGPLWDANLVKCLTVASREGCVEPGADLRETEGHG